MSSIKLGPAPSRIGVSRREFLGYAWLATLVAATGAGLRAGLRFAAPRVRPGELGGVINMGPAAELPPAGSAPVNVPAARFWLVSTDQGIVALHKACTHLDCLCEWDDQNREFVCPCHGSRFAEDGTYLEGPATRSLDRFVVQVEAPTNEIIAETDPASGAPVPLPSQSPLPGSVGGAGVAEAKAGEGEAADPGYIVHVDTGRKIAGAAPRQG